MKDLDSILSGSEPVQERETVAETVVETAPEPEKAQQERSPDGRFASKASEPAAAAPPAVEGNEPTPEKGGTVPQQALHAAREKARTETDRADRLERDLAELRGQISVLTTQRQQPPAQEQEQPKPIELWDDPDGFVGSKLTPIQQELAETRALVSHVRAEAQYGKDAVTAAHAAINDAIQRGELDKAQVNAQLAQSRDPVGDLVRWHQRSPAVQEQSMREKLRAEIMAELGLDATGATPTPEPAQAPSVMPTNLAAARNVGARSGPAWSGPTPLNDIFNRGRKTG